MKRREETMDKERFVPPTMPVLERTQRLAHASVCMSQDVGFRHTAMCSHASALVQPAEPRLLASGDGELDLITWNFVYFLAAFETADDSSANSKYISDLFIASTYSRGLLSCDCDGEESSSSSSARLKE